MSNEKKPTKPVKRYFTATTSSKTHIEDALAERTALQAKLGKTDVRVRIRRRPLGTFDVVVKNPRMVEE